MLAGKGLFCRGYNIGYVKTVFFKQLRRRTTFTKRIARAHVLDRHGAVLCRHLRNGISQSTIDTMLFGGNRTAGLFQ